MPEDKDMKDNGNTKSEGRTPARKFPPEKGSMGASVDAGIRNAVKKAKKSTAHMHGNRNIDKLPK